jgi:hypothetical protein
MILPSRPVHGSPDVHFCNVAAAPITSAVMQGYPSTTSPITMKEAAVEERDRRVSAGAARIALAVTR